MEEIQNEILNRERLINDLKQDVENLKQMLYYQRDDYYGVRMSTTQPTKPEPKPYQQQPVRSPFLNNISSNVK